MKPVALLALAVAVSTFTQSSGVLAIVNTTVIPMVTDDAVLPDHTIVMAKGRILALGPSASTPVPESARRIDGRETFVIPGLADMHVHLEHFEDPRILELFLTHGVTTVRNMDGRPYLLNWKRRTASGQLRGPRIYTAGPILDGSPPTRPDNIAVADAAAARRMVAAQAAAGYDFVKVYSGLSADAFSAIASAARANRLPVAGHVPRATGLPQAFASLDALEHLSDYAAAIEADDSPFKGKPHWSKRYLASPLDDGRLHEIAALQAKAGVWTVPTLVQPARELLSADEVRNLLSPSILADLPANVRPQWEEMTARATARMDQEDWKLFATASDNRLAVVAALAVAGVPLLAGTDTPNPWVVPGYSLHEELSLLVAAGLSPAEAIAASTREAARFVGGDWGTIAVGRIADLVVLEANPLVNIGRTRRIHTVIVGGVVNERTAR